MTRKPISFSASDKATVVRKYLIDKLPILKIAEQLHVKSALIHG